MSLFHVMSLHKQLPVKILCPRYDSWLKLLNYVDQTFQTMISNFPIIWIQLKLRVKKRTVLIHKENKLQHEIGFSYQAEIKSGNKLEQWVEDTGRMR